MQLKFARKTTLISTLFAAVVAFGGATSASADTPLPIPVPPTDIQPLTGADTLLTTFFSKSKISGAIRKDANGNLVMDDTGNFPFDFSGSIYYPVTTSTDGSVVGTSGPVGTVSGTVEFPPDFANLAFGVYGALTTGSAMPLIPPVINWTINNIKIVDAGTTYVPIPNNPAMGLKGRAFTGLGPVEIGTLLNGSNGLSMSVRMGGCFAVEATDGPNAGKIGTYCLNSTFTFNLAGIDLANPMQSTITGTGTSNCITVLQKPMQMQ